MHVTNRPVAIKLTSSPINDEDKVDDAIVVVRVDTGYVIQPFSANTYEAATDIYT